MGDPDSDWASLRGLLLGPHADDLNALRSRVETPALRAEDVGEVLPQVLMQHAHDPHLARALTPPLERAITDSVQRNPKPLADALFPVMGPAIRKAVAAGLAGMVESLNRTLEHSLSWRSVRWRLEALRTGKSFGEIVLLETLVYRVEEIFLIDRRTGLLLQHVQAGPAGAHDANMVSGMLTAIRDFAQDSFGVSESASLETIQVSDLSLWIEPGPFAIIAAAIRGTAPQAFRRVLQDALEAIHLEFGPVLQHFSGDASALDLARPALEACVHVEYRQSERHPRGRGAWILLGLVVVALLAWGVVAHRDNARWARYLDALRGQPGIVVVSAERRDGRFVVSGLRDPLAPDPMTFAAPAGLAAADVVGTWAPFEALDASIVLERARRALRPPDGVTLAVRDGVLLVTGAAPIDWIADTQRTAPLIAGITRFDAAGAYDAAIQSTSSRVEDRVLLFAKGSTQLAPGQEGLMQAILSDLRQLDAEAAAAGRRLVLDVVGHTDSEGPPETNLPLSLERARTVAAMVPAATVPHVTLAPAGVGSTAPAVTGQAEVDNQRNRRVTFHVGPAGTGR